MGSRVVASPPPPSNVVLDVDGCLTIGGAAVPGASEALRSIQRLGIRCVIATNNSTRSPHHVARRLGTVLGVAVPPESVVTSAMAAVSLLGPEHDPALVIGEEGIRTALAEAGIAATDDADAARSVIVGLDRRFDYDTLSRAARAAASGAALIATNDDPTFPSVGPDVPGAGALLAAVEAASGQRATVAGKPHAAMMRCVAALLDPGVTWMVGDRAETDVAFARAGGWFAVLVLSGITVAADLITEQWTPDLVIPSVADLPALLGQ
ncbi:MAG TPA: HAD-IIA family hydrolase [Acidimicrobiia bacterium]|nr:HAD-IIA family hydrolase [Acidimicrobiia bacterium]